MRQNGWYPGSFTKNFAWGKNVGLARLHENIRIGFNSELIPVERDEYRRRVANAGRPDFIPINFFLFNYIENGKSWLAIDELVFQAITSDHSSRFDLLAIFSFNFSHAGVWKGAQVGQRYPALWARNYVIDRVASNGWNTDVINAVDIESYLRGQPEFRAQTYTKVATNLAYLYKISSFHNFSSKRIERWWVDCLFLAMDRLAFDRSIDQRGTAPSLYADLLLESKFKELSGPVTPEKSFAMAHLLSLYNICGGLDRFKPERVRDLHKVLLPHYAWHGPNDNRPQGALHPTNPRILKSIPRDCSELARQAGFEIVLADDLEDLDPVDAIHQAANAAVSSLKRDNIRPVMSPEELHKLTRGE